MRLLSNVFALFSKKKTNSDSTNDQGRIFGIFIDHNLIKRQVANID